MKNMEKMIEFVEVVLQRVKSGTLDKNDAEQQITGYMCAMYDMGVLRALDSDTAGSIYKMFIDELKRI